MKIKPCHGLIAAMLTATAMLPASAQATDYSGFYSGLPVSLQPVTPPTIPAYEVSITDFGGVKDGVTLNTEAFAKAMGHLADKGGGRLVVPEGIWYTGPIQFESNIELHLRAWRPRALQREPRRLSRGGFRLGRTHYSPRHVAPLGARQA